MPQQAGPYNIKLAQCTTAQEHIPPLSLNKYYDLKISATSIKIKNLIDTEKKFDLEDVLLEHKNKSKCFYRMLAEK